MGEDDRNSVSVIGLGYVGLPLAELILRQGHTVFGIDLDNGKIDALLQGRSYLADIADEDIRRMIATGRFHPGSCYGVITESDFVIICVPTPLDRQAKPDLSYVRNAARAALPYLTPNQLVILESSTFPGTTEGELKSLFESAGWHIGINLFLAYSPERIDPGQKQFKLHQIPKIVGGVTERCTENARKFYERMFEKVFVVSSAKTAEMTKLLENCQRYVNISLMNEVMMFCDKMGISIWEVVEAASTKPYGFTPYWPGPGVGGHCIPVDPLYLLWRAQSFHTDLKFIERAHEINGKMPGFVVDKLTRALATEGKALSNSKVMVLGVTYKRDINDIRESPAIPIMKALLANGAELSYYDPYINEIKIDGHMIKWTPLDMDIVQEQDIILILTDHSGIDYQRIVDRSRLVLDTRNATSRVRKRDNVLLL